MMLQQHTSSSSCAPQRAPMAHTIVLRPLACVSTSSSSRDAQHSAFSTAAQCSRGGTVVLAGGAVRCASSAALHQQGEQQAPAAAAAQHQGRRCTAFTPWAHDQQEQGVLQGGPVAPGQSLQLVEGRSYPSVEHTATALAALTACCALALSAPAAAHASGGGEALTGEAAALFGQFLDKVESMGPAGAVLFVVVVMLFEMVPLFPTQPLSLASGLLFGAQKGGLLMLLGVTLAALNAFLIARGVGRPLAQRVIAAEMSHEGAEASGAIAKTMAGVQAAIDEGGLWKQMTAITLLRLTPVVPFSASNYLLGLTPVQLPAFVGGTITGMSVWSALYASLGGASRALLDKGADMETLLADLSGRASALSSHALGITGGLAGAAVLVLVVQKLLSTTTSTTPSNSSNNNAPGGSNPGSSGSSSSTKAGGAGKVNGGAGGGAGGHHLMVGLDSGDALVGSSGSGAGTGPRSSGASTLSASSAGEEGLGRETVSSLVGRAQQARPGERA